MDGRWEREGFEVIPSLLNAEEGRDLLDGIKLFDPQRAGTRNLLDEPFILEACRMPVIFGVVSRILGPGAFCVRAILFDKTAESNWALDFHQDTKIAVTERIDCAGYSGWSVKEGVVHVCPPERVLARQVALRVHLDPCFAANGAVEVIPGSHRLGIIPERDVPGIVEEGPRVTAEGPAGSALVFQSLLLHGSKKATEAGRRRILHFEFCDQELDGGLRWKWQVSLGSPK